MQLFASFNLDIMLQYTATVTVVAQHWYLAGPQLKAKAVKRILYNSVRNRVILVLPC